MHGSGTLVRGLLEAGLVDELRLMLYPMVLGSGKRLWGETTDKHVFALKRTETVGDGITILVYERTA